MVQQSFVNRESYFNTQKRLANFAIIAITLVFCIICVSSPAMAKDPLTSILEAVVENVVVRIFQAIGFILAAYGIGALLLAFKNDDADSKSRSGQSIAVGAFLLGIGTIIDKINLSQYL